MRGRVLTSCYPRFHSGAGSTPFHIFHIKRDTTGGDYASPLWHSMLRPSGRDKLAVAALLIQHGADTHYRHPKIYAHCQTTPLHVAVFTLNFEAVDLLLANGADLRARDLQGRTPLACAQEHEQVHKGADTPQIKKMIDLLSGYERTLQR